MILTYNEAPNIARTLSKLCWARRILVVDSFSTDETRNIARGFPTVEVVQRKFDTFAGQCNFGLERVDTPWVLSLDADYVLTDEMVGELGRLEPGPDIAGYSAGFVYCVYGRPLRASLYPPRVVLYRRERACYRDDGHGHKVSIEGSVASLRSSIFHDDRKPLDRWLAQQNRYMVAEARNLLNTPLRQLNFPDRLRRKIFLAPALVLFYTLFGKRLILDGWPGFFYVAQRFFAEVLLSLRLLEARLIAEPTGKGE